MDKKFWHFIKVEHVFILFMFVFSYLIWVETNNMEREFKEIERQWDSLDVVIEQQREKLYQIDSINDVIAKDLQSFEEYR